MPKKKKIRWPEIGVVQVEYFDLNVADTVVS